jgi:hypothetical protein
MKNVVAVVSGIIAGMIVNMGLIILGSSIIELPEGTNPMDPESIKANIHLFEAKHYIFPFLAHALGTLVGAYIVARVAHTYKFKLAIAIGVFFLFGGIWNAMSLPAPSWFIVLDLVCAYIPMGWLGWKLNSGN